VVDKRKILFSGVAIILVSFIAACQRMPQENRSGLHEGMVLIPGGKFIMGARSEQAGREEFPRHEESISAFYMDVAEVTNAQFSKFIEATGYITTAERNIDWQEMKKQVPAGTPKPADSLLVPGSLVFKMTSTAVDLSDYAQWWTWTIGANWQHPEGPGSTIANRMNHPVVHISWLDDNVYAKWAGKRLPTEAEWEWAASGGSSETIYPWGNEPANESAHKANFWQGFFPYDNKEEDGFAGTAPVKSFPANQFGLYDMGGNVWEWCSDIYNNLGYVEMPEDRLPGSRTYSIDSSVQAERVLRGGSFLCNDSYCSGYRVSGRVGSSADSGLSHTGFRCVKDMETSSEN
jgi:formylglycine-generating enzyme